MEFNKLLVGILIFQPQATITKRLCDLLQCKMTLTKVRFSNLGMETLLNAPLHASQQRDKVSLK